LYQILIIETLQIMEIISKKFDNANYCVPLVIFQKFKIRVHTPCGSFCCVFTFKEFQMRIYVIFEEVSFRRIFQCSHHFLIFDGHGSHVILETKEHAQQFDLDMITLHNHTFHTL
jgi:hypothetical protein